MISLSFFFGSHVKGDSGRYFYDAQKGKCVNSKGASGFNPPQKLKDNILFGRSCHELGGRNLENVRLKGDYRGSLFDKSNLRNADLSFARFNGASFRNADLRGAKGLDKIELDRNTVMVGALFGGLSQEIRRRLAVARIRAADLKISDVEFEKLRKKELGGRLRYQKKFMKRRQQERAALNKRIRPTVSKLGKLKRILDSLKKKKERELRA